MPKTTKQRRGEVIASLRHLSRITSDDLEQALTDAGIKSPNAVRAYTSKLEALGYLERIPGGWKLADSCRTVGTVTVKVVPGHHTADVRRAISAAIRPFRGIATMEIEV